LKCAVDDVKDARKLLIEVRTKAQAKNVLAMITWIDQAVTVTPHRSLNTSRVIVRCRDFHDCDEGEALDALSYPGVTEIKRIMFKKMVC